MMEYLAWVFLAVALFGTYLNARKLRASYLVWLASNIYFAIHHAVNRDMPMTLFFLAGMAFCWYGWARWSSVKARAYDAAQHDPSPFDDMTDAEFDEFLDDIQNMKKGTTE